MQNNSKTIVFSDLDGTLIDTITGETFPKGVWDMKIKFDVLDKIKKEYNPKYLFIVTNQGGLGTFVNLENFVNKLNYIKSAIKEYLDCIVDFEYCGSLDKTHKCRKPNIGMADILLNSHFLTDVGLWQMIMIGDASGKEGNFSDSDKKFAENLGIEYIDVNDLLCK